MTIARAFLRIAATAFLFGAAATLSTAERAVSPVPDLTLNLAAFAPIADPPAPPELGVGFHDLEDEEALDAVRAAGFTFVRTDLFWEHIEDDDGSLNYSMFAPFQDLIEERDMWTLWILDYGHWNHGHNSFARPSDRAAWARYVREGARTFLGRRVVFEVWNEPDVEEGKFLAPELFASLINATVAAVRGAGSDAPVITGGLSWTDPAYLRPMVRAFNGRRPEVAAVGIHLYRNSAPEFAIDDMETMHAIADPLFGAEMSWWNTEWAFNSLTDYGMEEALGAHNAQNQAYHGVLAARIALTSWLTRMQKTVWYIVRDSSDDPESREGNMGLLSFEGEEKPALRAFRQFSAAAAGRRLTGFYDRGPDDFYAIRLTGEGDPVVVAWTAVRGFETRVLLPADAVVEARDAEGRPLNLTRDAAGRVAAPLSERAGPIYFTLRAGSF